MSEEIQIVYPPVADGRGIGYWLNWKNVWDSRRKILRSDRSNEWRYSFSKRNPEPISRSVAFSKLLKPSEDSGFKFIILGDTGEGDRSQYALLPLIRKFNPDFMIINGDVAYPAGRVEDFMAGFFEPYRGLNIPIWAVPGNHEYYSKYMGQEFYDIFCTGKWARVWEDYGLRFVKQPGTYWELTDPDGQTPLVVIGIDTGKTGDLDGYRRGNSVDRAQLSWLNGRLKIAEDKGKKVMILFHIPALANQEFIKETHLFQLHFLIAKYSCVRMVIGAHYHNHQRYTPDVFRQFLNKVAPAAQSRDNIIHYIVNGNGGASLANTNFKEGPYPAQNVYPTAAQWKEYVKIGKRIMDRRGVKKNLLKDLMGRIAKDVSSDVDPAGLLSFLLVDVGKTSIKVHHVAMDEVRLLFPPGMRVNIVDENPLLDDDAVQSCIKDTIVV